MDRSQAFPSHLLILEDPSPKRLKYAGDGDNSGGLFSFTLAHTDARVSRAMKTRCWMMEHDRNRWQHVRQLARNGKQKSLR